MAPSHTYVGQVNTPASPAPLNYKCAFCGHETVRPWDTGPECIPDAPIHRDMMWTDPDGALRTVYSWLENGRAIAHLAMTNLELGDRHGQYPVTLPDDLQIQFIAAVRDDLRLRSPLASSTRS
jgi:hypothetical protein